MVDYTVGLHLTVPANFRQPTKCRHLAKCSWKNLMQMRRSVLSFSVINDTVVNDYDVFLGPIFYYVYVWCWQEPKEVGPSNLHNRPTMLGFEFLYDLCCWLVASVGFVLILNHLVSVRFVRSQMSAFWCSDMPFLMI